MATRRKFYRLSFERLERRDTPSNFGVTFTPATHTLNIVGTGQNDTITIEGNAADPTMFALSSPGGDTFDNNATFNSPTGVQNIAMTLLGGNTVFFDDAVVPIDLQGSLSINGGNGDNILTTLDMSVAKNLTVVNGNGGSTTTIERGAAGFSSIGGNLSITNGTGGDITYITDMNVGGNVTVNDGHGDGTTAGRTEIFNNFNTSVRSLIKGNVTVSYLDGIVGPEDGIWDTEVKGNVTFNQGTGTAQANFDGFATSLPVLILGNLTITGSGSNTVTVGTEYNKTGLIVGGSFTITTPATTPPSNPVGTLSFTNLQVGLATTLGLGNGADSVTIDTSEFTGAFTLTTGAGNDTVNMNTVDVDGSLTINGGGGANIVTASFLQVGGNLAISSSNTSAANAISSGLADLTVAGSATFNNGNGDTMTEISHVGGGFNSIGGNLIINNGTGKDYNYVNDTNIGGNATVNNGNGDAASGLAGPTEFLDLDNPTTRAEIKGNLSVSYLTEDQITPIEIYDTQIDGNATIATGSGSFPIDIDGLNTALPVLVRGNLAIIGSGANTVNVGITGAKTGLIVGGNFTIATPATTPHTTIGTLDFANLQVGLATSLQLGNGNDSVTISTSQFNGAFVLATGAGNDSVYMTSVDVNGSLAINGGSGANIVTASFLQVGGNLAISSSNTSAANAISSGLADLTVAGSATFNNGNGDTMTEISHVGGGFNSIGGNLIINNGTGKDYNYVNDTNIGGNATVNNGNGDAASGLAGPTEFLDLDNPTTRAEIKGNLSVSYLTEDQITPIEIYDTQIDGNATIATGSGSFPIDIDGLNTALPVLVRGNLAIIGSGANTVNVGITGAKTGLIVGGNFTIATPATTPHTSPIGTLDFANLQVGLATSLQLGNGNDSVTISTSQFNGAFVLATGAGNDTTTMTTVDVDGALTINDASGANTVTATDLQVGGNLTISSSNTSATNDQNSYLAGLTVAGSATFNNGNGNTETNINHGVVAGFNTIGGNLVINNGTGEDINTIYETNVGGNVAINNGNGDASRDAGLTWFAGARAGERAEIKGNLSISYLTGNQIEPTQIFDMQIDGNATIANGSGTFETDIDGEYISLPVLIRGNLTITGSGANTVNVGTTDAMTGLIVGGSFTIATPATTPHTSPAGIVDLFDLQVTGNTNITLGNGNDAVTIDDSIFHGTFTLTTGSGNDTVNIETTATPGINDPTIFDAPVLINLGAGNDTVNREGTSDPNQEIFFYDSFIIHHGTGADSYTDIIAKEISPFGNSVLWVI